MAFTILAAFAMGGANVNVSPTGDDRQSGTIDHPFATLTRALDAIAKRLPGRPINVELRGGTYYLPETVSSTSAHSGTAEAPVTVEGYQNEKVVLSGGEKLSLDWKAYEGPMLQAKAPDDLETEELFVNGERQILARYPNFDPHQRIFNGFAAGAISKERVAKWADPAGGYFHAMHPSEWGDYRRRILGKKPNGELELEGGWRNNRPAGPHPLHRFVENIFEELRRGLPPGELRPRSAWRQRDIRRRLQSASAVSLASDCQGGSKRGQFRRRPESCPVGVVQLQPDPATLGRRSI